MQRGLVVLGHLQVILYTHLRAHHDAYEVMTVEHLAAILMSRARQGCSSGEIAFSRPLQSPVQTRQSLDVLGHHDTHTVVTCSDVSGGSDTAASIPMHKIPATALFEQFVSYINRLFTNSESTCTAVQPPTPAMAADPS